ncbi:MAG TPA: GNAT family N-acetyltransferase [Chthoniobacterales bacterium]|nr:GNAT family N-acetyltransferase [Chthoniobacterales bacterium]
MQIVRARPEDAEALTEIAFAAKRHWGYPERWIQIWRDVLTVTPALVAANPTFSAIEDDRVVGFSSLAAEPRPDLTHLWVLPSSMGRGFGRALFDRAVEQGRALGFSAFQIEADPNAEPFYLHMGAKRVGISVTEIEGERRELPLLIYELS